jgi:hypothetical protein
MQRAGYLWLNSWAGRTKHRVTIIGETPKRYRIRWDDKPALQWTTGEVRLVPMYAVTFRAAGEE